MNTNNEIFIFNKFHLDSDGDKEFDWVTTEQAEAMFEYNDEDEGIFEKIEKLNLKQFPNGLELVDFKQGGEKGKKFKELTGSVGERLEYVLKNLTYGCGTRPPSFLNLTKSIPCNSHQRSSGDLYLTLKHYDDKVTYKEVITTLIANSEMRKYGDSMFLNWYCGGQRKMVFSVRGYGVYEAYTGYRKVITEYDELFNKPLALYVEHLIKNQK